LTILLAGASGTPYANGLFRLKLHVANPGSYPSSPPTATFLTKIFHPNVDQNTGAVCVDTLKRDWKPELKLYDVLVTIGCLLVYPNPESALNAEAGALLVEDYDLFRKRAETFVRMYAPVPESLKTEVVEANQRIVGGKVKLKDAAPKVVTSIVVDEQAIQPPQDRIENLSFNELPATLDASLNLTTDSKCQAGKSDITSRLSKRYSPDVSNATSPSKKLRVDTKPKPSHLNQRPSHVNTKTRTSPRRLKATKTHQLSPSAAEKPRNRLFQYVIEGSSLPKPKMRSNGTSRVEREPCVQGDIEMDDVFTDMPPQKSLKPQDRAIPSIEEQAFNLSTPDPIVPRKRARTSKNPPPAFAPPKRARTSVPHTQQSLSSHTQDLRISHAAVSTSRLLPPVNDAPEPDIVTQFTKPLLPASGTPFEKLQGGMTRHVNPFGLAIGGGSYQWRRPEKDPFVREFETGWVDGWEEWVKSRSNRE
jgi:ubiquitin-protein ligase